jgi:hypothetical protein
MSSVVPVVIDIGSQTLKAGLGSSDEPYLVGATVENGLGIDRVSSPPYSLGDLSEKDLV